MWRRGKQTFVVRGGKLTQVVVGYVAAGTVGEYETRFLGSPVRTDLLAEANMTLDGQSW